MWGRCGRLGAGIPVGGKHPGLIVGTKRCVWLGFTLGILSIGDVAVARAKRHRVLEVCKPTKVRGKAALKA